uniref:Protein kinase domain-containing protein n=1 Tax=Panagrellus redivivus TaxID=6233 RepID=A0A7E4VXS8_PANRE
MDSTNLEKYKDQIKKSVLLTHYLPFNKPYDAGSRCVLICQCRKTNESVTVTVQQLPSTYNVKDMLEKAFTHPHITPLINCIADTKANLLIGVSTNPSGKYIEDYAKENKDKTKSFFRRNVQFIMVKLLTLLNAMHERGNGLHPFNEKSVILTTTNGGDIIDLVVRRCHLYCKSKSQTKQKAHLLYVARNLGYIGDDIEEDNLLPVELEFFRACHQKSEVTIAELMEMRYIKRPFASALAAFRLQIHFIRFGSIPRNPGRCHSTQKSTGYNVVPTAPCASTE